MQILIGGEASWCSWSDVLPMLLLAWILWLAPLCLIIIICNHKNTYNTETTTSTLILYSFWKSYQHIAKCLSIFFAKYLPYSAYDCGNDMDLRRHLHCWCYGVKPCSQTIDLVYKCGLKKLLCYYWVTLRQTCSNNEPTRHLNKQHLNIQTPISGIAFQANL